MSRPDIPAPLRARGRASATATRATNRVLVLHHLLDAGAMSRADLSRLTGLSPAAISGLVGELIADGLVVADDVVRDESRVGKPPTRLRVCADARAVVVADLSRPDGIAVATVDLAGEALSGPPLVVDDVDGRRVAGVLVDAIRAAVDSSPVPVLGVGVGTPGVVDGDGTVLEASRFGWHGVPLGSLLREATHRPVHVGNDANLAAVAEFARRHGDERSLAVVRIGAGVGLGLVLEDRPHRGESRAAGEIGHLVVDPAGPRCECGHRGCLETFVSVPRLEHEVARGVDPTIVVRTATERLGAALAAIVAVVDVRRIVVSGPRDHVDEKFCELTVASLRRRCLDRVGAHVDVELSALGDDAVLRGAATLVTTAELEGAA